LVRLEQTTRIESIEREFLQRFEQRSDDMIDKLYISFVQLFLYSGKSFTYSLRLRERKGILEEAEKHCSTAYSTERSPVPLKGAAKLHVAPEN